MQLPHTDLSHSDFAVYGLLFVCYPFVLITLALSCQISFRKMFKNDFGRFI